MNSYDTYFENLGKEARSAAYVLQNLKTEKKRALLSRIQETIKSHGEAILTANAKDMASAKENGVPSIMMDRLLLTAERIDGILEGVRQVSDLEDPIGEVLESFTRPNGIHIEKRRVPLGVIGMIFEARPNVTVDAAVLAMMTGNAIILRGGKEAFHTNQAFVKAMQEALTLEDLPIASIQLVEILDREAVSSLLQQRRWIDVIIPRGGARLIERVVRESSIPVIETGSGVVHIYVDESADLDMATNIIINAKTQRPSVCNAMETLLVHEHIAPQFVEHITRVLGEKNVKIFGDSKAISLVKSLDRAEDDAWSTEYNDLIMNLKIVDSIDEAIDHINRYSTRHSECIITNDEDHANRFLNAIDASTVYVNASTRFTDGFEFGLGAEIGISTQKLHARGPMGLKALTSYKFIVKGTGQVR